MLYFLFVIELQIYEFACPRRGRTSVSTLKILQYACGEHFNFDRMLQNYKNKLECVVSVDPRKAPSQVNLCQTKIDFLLDRADYDNFHINVAERILHHRMVNFQPDKEYIECIVESERRALYHEHSIPIEHSWSLSNQIFGK